jgi:hypothetical protein
MRVGCPATSLQNSRVQSSARAAASLIAASLDPPGLLGLFLGTLADGLSAETAPVIEFLSGQDGVFSGPGPAIVASAPV